MRILLVEDEPEMARLIASQLDRAGYLVDVVGSLDEAATALRLAKAALIVLDRRLPDGDGLSLLREARALQPGVPVIVLSALDDLGSKVGGLDAGADDYLTKPFERDELLARVRAALRRPGAEPSPSISCGALTFDPTTRELFISGVAMILKRRELTLIESLIRRVGRVVPREVLMSEVYGFDDEIQSNTLDSHVSRLRARLLARNAGVVIHPVRGVGYLLDTAS